MANMMMTIMCTGMPNINYLLRKKNLIPMSKEIVIKIYSSISLSGAFVYLGINITKAIKTQKPAILIMFGLSPLLRLMNILVLENFFLINLKTINTHTMYPIRTIVEKDTYFILEFNNKNLTVYKTTIGLIISYLSAIILPRINDIVRCYILSKTDKVKISVSIGSVITERIFDVISIFLLILLLLLFEFDRFYNYLMIEVVGNAEFDFLMFLLISILLIILIFYFIIIKFFHSSNYYEKFKEKVGELKSGMVSIFKMKKKIEFLISTIILWLLYFVVGYLIFFSMEETSHLGLSAALSILVAGALGTIVPVNAGIGAYHLFVASILIYYGIEYEDGLFFATILHGSQVITILFFGLVSLVLLYLDVFRKNK